MENKKGISPTSLIDLIQVLNEQKETILNWVQYVDYVQRNEFDLILASIGLKKDRNLIGRLFWYGCWNEGVGYSISMGMERSITMNSNIQSTCSVSIVWRTRWQVYIVSSYTVFFELCDENDDGYFDEEDLKRFLYKNLQNEEEARTMKFVLHDFYTELNPKSNIKGVTKYP